MAVPNVCFYIRGNSLTARYARGDNRHAFGLQASGPSPSKVISVIADAQAIGGQTINKGNPSASIALLYQGRENCPNTQRFTAIMRCKIFSANGAVGMWGMGAFGLIGAPGFSSGVFNSGFRTRAVTSFGFIPINTADLSYAASPPNVTGASYNDIVWKYSRASGAGACQIFVNGTSIGTYTASNAYELPIDNLAWASIHFGMNGVFNSTDVYMNEFALIEGDIDVNSIELESGNGALNGSSRSSFLNIPSYSGISWPAVAKVKNDTSWNEYGVAKTGTRTDPTAAQVKSGVQYGAAGTEFTGNVTLPAAGDVEAGVQYGALGTEFTGSLETGAIDPGVDNVLEGVDYEIAGIPLTGTYGTVTEAQVQDGVEFGPNDSLTGSFGRHIPQTNQYFAPLEVQAEIFAVLNADADLTTLLGANKIFDFVPDKKAFPYVTINALPFTERDNATNDGLECEFQINVWYQPGKTGQTSRGNKPVQLIQKRIDELLQLRSLCVNGWNVLQLRRTFIDILVESDNVTRQGIQRFKLFLGSKD